ncbi:MAG TPA: glycosyltransferase [Puia sp.]|nr:glycosyltransferase [Puia sp.]
MKISVIIAFYKNLPFLDLILAGLKRQSYDNFEVIIAEDDDAPATKEYIANMSRQLPFPLQHVCQQDNGFRKNRILNAAIRTAAGEFITFLDGDCIPHRHWLKEYARTAHEGSAFFGRRVMVSQRLTKKLLATGNKKLLSFYSHIRHGSERKEDGIYLPFFRKSSKNNGIWGCNWGILKKHLLEVNGYDEDYISAGVGEDVDIEWRLLAKSIKLQSMKHRAIVYHLYHAAHYSTADLEGNYAMVRAKQEAGLIYCINGLDRHPERTTGSLAEGQS